MSIATMDWHVRALTDMWTGDATGQGQRTITTGLLGSLRWWFEVLVRGLGGAACDPSVDGNRCPTNEGQRCLVCELFGCTGRARKFRFDVRDSSGAIMSNQIKRNTTFVLRFTPLRPNAVEEWTLLDLTIRLIAEYGAIGGRTVLKPSDEANRHNLSHHRDYGIIRVEQRPKTARVPLTDLERYACLDRWRRPREEGFIWASLANFWCVNGRYLARQDPSHSTFNRVILRPEPKSRAANGDSWLAGQRPNQSGNVIAASKKVFSFKNPPRTFGFIYPGPASFDRTRGQLRIVWKDPRDYDFVTGDAILAQLTSPRGPIQ